MDFLTTDLCDAQPDKVQVLEPLFRAYGGRTRFGGQMVTLKLFEDNALVRSTLSEPGRGRVLVVDGGGSLRCALLGDQLGELAVQNGWAGVLVFGAIRDSVALGKLPLGIRALNTHPMKSIKRGEGQRDLSLRFAGVTLQPGHWLYADEDGIIVSADALL
ncbi:MULTISPECIES: ribonuclease E activity regulator RraA [unclassified Paludibacterium]|uniref:ribonuclease E activity regulator RraA n=1 Tax=unclassified Paludibacterium TaxID=2618429 RepID=UPI001C040C2A|nr:ribonuclease E activity regulator RraA [Paludibacterium sp. B53371]BEV70553.1 ribonuclease E activity regulator RraA [Paludibacterium sp. THUN1379]